jgi:hypothetical protein
MRHAQRERTYRPGYGGYVSEFTQFIDHYLDEHPEVVQDQHKGWYRLWDHKLDPQDPEQAKGDSAPVKGYDYF